MNEERFFFYGKKKNTPTKTNTVQMITDQLKLFFFSDPLLDQ